MKKISFFCLMLISTTQFLHAQTTWDEYNYCTKGYREVLQNGTNAKIGYTVREVLSRKINWGDKEYSTAWLKGMYKNSTNEIVAYILVYQLRDKANDQRFYCIPHPDSNSDIISTYLNSITEGSADVNAFYRLSTMFYAISFGLKW